MALCGLVFILLEFHPTGYYYYYYYYYYVNNKYITCRLFRGLYENYIALGAKAPTLVKYDYLIVRQN